jgi:hypothetical protein
MFAWTEDEGFSPLFWAVKAERVVLNSRVETHMLSFQNFQAFSGIAVSAAIYCQHGTREAGQAQSV